MIARMVTNRIKDSRMDDWVELIRDAVVPSLREQPGFAGFVVLASPETGKSIGYSMWDSEASLLASESSGNYQQQIATLGSVLEMPPIREIYELTVLA